MEKRTISFHSDRIKVLGPKIDGSYAVTFEVGEYEQMQVAKLLAIPQNTEIKVKVETSD